MFIAFHISGTIHHVIFIYGTHVQNNTISRSFFQYFKILIFRIVSGVKGQKMTQNEKKLSAALHISRTIRRMIVIYGTHVQNDNISRCFLHFFKILILQFVSGIKGQKMTQNDKKFCLS